MSLHPVIEYARANRDVVRGVRWVATLDTHTCPKCRIRDLLGYTLDLAPDGHSVPWLDGPDAIHDRCRCVMVPIVIPLRDIGLRDVSEGSRASMYGQVPASMSYATWISAQAPDVMTAAMGAVRAQLMRGGLLLFRQMYDASGRYLSIDELRALHPAQFAIARL